MHTSEILPRDWYVLYSKPRKEEQVQFYLGLKGVESFFPRLQLPGAAKTKKKIVPLFPNYLFARLHLQTECQYVMWSPGVKRIVSFSDNPVPLEHSIIDFLQRQADSHGVIQSRSHLKPGEQVEISGGPFDGLLGIIEDPPDSNGRVKVLLKLLSRQISVKLGIEFIKGDGAGFRPVVAHHIAPSLVSAAG